MDWATLLPFAVAGGLLLALAWPMLTWWWWEWTKPESYYAHAPLIPLLVGLMLWHRRDALRAAPKAPCAWRAARAGPRPGPAGVRHQDWTADAIDVLDVPADDRGQRLAGCWGRASSAPPPSRWRSCG